MENKWRDRYYELESTLENILSAVQVRMERIEKGSDAAAPFQISKVTRSNNLGDDFIHCVASGINLEFSFEFLNGDALVKSVPFQRSNSVPVALGASVNATHCKISVRENAGMNEKLVLERKIKL